MAKTKLNLLLADDDEDDCLFFREVLEELPLNTNLQTVHDGVELMNYLDSLEQLPDVLFLDLNMPLKKGAECLSEIKQNDKLKKLPVVIISTSLDMDVVNSLHQNGAHYYIRKPGNFSKLEQLIHTALTLITENNSQPARDNFIIHSN
jgi:CheY-like chemotaxis protein